MLILGSVGAGTRREQALASLAYLDNAGLEWWRVESLQHSIKVAREQLQAGEQPSRILELALDNGMCRLARRLPYVLWGSGPWDVRPEKQVAGLWPNKQLLMQALHLGRVRRSDQHREATTYQKYWLVITPESYQLQGLSKKPIWIMHGRWTTVADEWYKDTPERWR